MTHDHDPDFTNPKLNGAQPMTDVETIAEVLAAHDDCVTGCNVAPTGVRDHEMQYEVTFTCGAAFPLPSDVSPRELDAAHRAAALEPVIREREKKAWDACLASIVYPDGEPLEVILNNNPYDTKEEA